MKSGQIPHDLYVTITPTYNRSLAYTRVYLVDPGIAVYHHLVLHQLQQQCDMRQLKMELIIYCKIPNRKRQKIQLVKRSYLNTMNMLYQILYLASSVASDGLAQTWLQAIGCFWTDNLMLWYFMQFDALLLGIQWYVFLANYA